MPLHGRPAVRRGGRGGEGGEGGGRGRVKDAAPGQSRLGAPVRGTGGDRGGIRANGDDFAESGGCTLLVANVDWPYSRRIAGGGGGRGGGGGGGRGWGPSAVSDVNGRKESASGGLDRPHGGQRRECQEFVCGAGLTITL